MMSKMRGPSAFNILIDDYEIRRHQEISSAKRSCELYGSWLQYAADWLKSMVQWERAPGRQWGSAHHQTALIAEGLTDDIEKILKCRQALEHIATYAEDENGTVAHLGRTARDVLAEVMVDEKE